LGKLDQNELPSYYGAADLLIVPSTHEEGFGRVILESLACGTPVIGSRRGAIPEAMDETVGRLIDVTPENIKEAVEYFYKNPKELKKLSKNARKFAERRYSERNVGKIIGAYMDKS
jgi:glycosyltransferase involved in cell wall biosynthesis